MDINVFLQATRRIRRTIVTAENRLYEYHLLPTRNIPFPDFLGIGAMKSGTTWLYENLYCHPEIFLPATKELYHFSIHFHKQSLKRYCANFSDAGERKKGDITPGYGIINIDRIRYIKALNPDMRLIFLIRNPIYRTWSEAYMNLVVKRQRALHDIDYGEFCSYIESDACRKRSDYAQIINNWLRFFPREQMFVGLYEEISDHPKQLLTNLFRFLGVTTDIDWKYFPFNKVIMPRYESYGGVRSGYINAKRTDTENLLPDVLKEHIRQIYAPKIEELVKSHGLPVEQWLSTSNQG